MDNIEKDWVDTLSKEQLFDYANRHDIAPSRLLSNIKERFSSKDDFVMYMTKPKRAVSQILEEIPDFCGICKYYNINNTSLRNVYCCLVYKEWPTQRAFFEYCDDFELDTDKLCMLTERKP